MATLKYSSQPFQTTKKGVRLLMTRSKLGSLGSCDGLFTHSPKFKVKHGPLLSLERSTSCFVEGTGTTSGKIGIACSKSHNNWVSRETIKVQNSIQENVETIRTMLNSMSDGEISISPYDTAWMALVKNDQTTDVAPQFPSCLQWIVDNQLEDGSWGDKGIFSAYDRLINTLACVIALKSWDVHPDKRERGILFVRENMGELENETPEHLPPGFEVVFPVLVALAQSHGIEVVVADSPALQEVYAKRKLKLQRIPKEIIQTKPTTLLLSLEGVTHVDWEKLLKLQSEDGSFLNCVSSTAYAFMQTKNSNCFKYLNKVAQRFDGGVPFTYPIDIFERLWAIDRLQRLGISRYLQPEIEGCMRYVHRYWTEQGIGAARNSQIKDLDDTAMGFRLLRLHGYDISADVFKNFEKDGKFFCYAGQSSEAVTVMHNLLRASQLQYPGEKILEEARIFSSKYLREKQASNQLFDKWVIAKDVAGEVAYALNIPWYANLPRVETRFYIEQYGGENDVWIGKTLYRLPNVSNNIYLELAKVDYNKCQELHRLEWDCVLRWHLEHNLEDFGVSQKNLLKAYFLTMATMFEPEKSKQRLAWAKTTILLEMLTSNFGKGEAGYEDRKEFVAAFRSSYNNHVHVGNESLLYPNEKRQRLLGLLLGTLNHLSSEEVATHNRDIKDQLCRAWEKWLKIWEEEGHTHKEQAKLLIHIIEICAGHRYSDMFSDPGTLYLLDLTNRVCEHLELYRQHNDKVGDARTSSGIIGIRKGDNKATIVEHDMQKLVELLLSNSLRGINRNIKQTILTVVKTFYYSAYCSPQEIDHHIAKVLFQKVE